MKSNNENKSNKVNPNIKLQGTLTTNKKGEFILYQSATSVNLSKELNEMLMDEVRLNILNGEGKIIYSQKGELLLDKSKVEGSTNKPTYKYSCNGMDFQGLLNSLMNKKMTVEIKVIKSINDMTDVEVGHND